MTDDLPPGVVELYRKVDALFIESRKANWEIAIVIHLLEMHYLGAYVKAITPVMSF